jgi:hypothetical protein
MADVAECITKLRTAGKISGKIADEALEFYKSSRAQYSRHLSPASADAAAALDTAKHMHDTSVKNSIAIARDVKRWQTIQKRILDDPRRNAALCRFPHAAARLALLETDWQCRNHAKIRGVTSDAELGGDTEHRAIP